MNLTPSYLDAARQVQLVGCLLLDIGQCGMVNKPCKSVRANFLRRMMPANRMGNPLHGLLKNLPAVTAGVSLTPFFGAEVINPSYFRHLPRLA